MGFYTPPKDEPPPSGPHTFCVRQDGSTFEVIDTASNTVLFTRTDPIEAIALAEGLRSGLVYNPKER